MPRTINLPRGCRPAQYRGAWRAIAAVCLLFIGLGVAHSASEPSEAALKEALEHNKKGADHFEKKSWERAIAEFQAALRAVPNHPYAMYNIGVCYTKWGRIKEAKDAYQRLLKVYPKLADGWTNLGELYDSENDLKTAEECYRKAIAAEPDFGMAHHNLGVLLENTDRVEDAVAEYRKHVEIEDAKKRVGDHEPDRDPYAYYSLGVFYLNRAQTKWGNLDHGMIKDAKALFTKAHQLDEDSIYINNALGNIYIIEGNAGLALSYFQTAAATARKQGTSYAPLNEGFGDVYCMQGEIAKAKEEYHKALKLRADYASVYHKLGDLAAKEKDPKKAIDYFQNYLKYGKDADEKKRVAKMIEELKRQP